MGSGRRATSIPCYLPLPLYRTPEKIAGLCGQTIVMANNGFATVQHSVHDESWDAMCVLLPKHVRQLFLFLFN